MNRMLLKAILLIFLLLDTAYSFVQHYQMPLDGDIAAIVLPCKDYQRVLADPFGMGVLLNGEQYPGPNRFFAHWGMSAYFKSVPFVFQHFVSPIDSVYLSCALFKTMVQVFLIWLITLYICSFSFNKNKEILVAAMIAPLFQTFGYRGSMGVIDHSITYVFFYSLPVGLMFLFLLPFYRALLAKEPLRLSIPLKIIWLFMPFALALGGPLVPGMALIFCPMLVVLWGLNHWPEGSAALTEKAWGAFKKIPLEMLFYFGLFIVLCLYSLYLGSYNSENGTSPIGLMERFGRIPQGIFMMLTDKIGLPLLWLAILYNIFIINQQKTNIEARKLIKIFGLVILFGSIYTLLLPFGGYREYRPFIVRFDTILPVTIALFFVFGLTTSYILQASFFQKKKFYQAGLLAFLLIFTIADKIDWKKNDCERGALTTLSRATENPVLLENNCTVLSWQKIGDPQYSENVAQLLELWGIASPKRRFYQK